MVLSEACRMLSRDAILAINKRFRCAVLLDASVRDVISSLRLRRRGCRGGEHQRRHFMARQCVTSSVNPTVRAGVIPTIFGNRRPGDVPSQLSASQRDERSAVRRPCRTVIRRVNERRAVRIGLLNAQSVANKSASICRWIAESKLSIAALVETWHDDASSPHLIACAPPGFKYIERARPRKDAFSTSTNHGGVCLMYEPSLNVRTVQLPTFSTFEAVAASAHRAGFNATVVAVYRPGSRSVTQSFLNDFSDLLERLTTLSAPLMIVGDFNIHVDDSTDIQAGKLRDIIASHSLHQHVTSPTHTQGHTLDLVITHENQTISVHPVDPPLLSDHSFVVADCDCLSPSVESASTRQVCNWRELDVDAFAAELQCSELVAAPPSDVESAVNAYNTTLRALLDKYAPADIKRVRTGVSTARWYDRECRVTKRTTRKLERRYRRLRDAESRAAWRHQFDMQRRLYQSKFTSFWLATVNTCEGNPRVLWQTVSKLLQPPRQQATDKLSADDFGRFFRSKVDNIRMSTASAEPPVIVARQSPPLSSFTPATVSEIINLLNKTPAKSCELDPIPTWLLKRLSSYIAPVICHICNLSLQSGVFPAQLKQARVLPLLKKSNMDPDIASSYRPISNLPYISKLVERVVTRRFTAHCSAFNLLPTHQSAYRPFHSTETALLSVHNNLVRSIDNGHVSLLVLLDLSAAFDTVDHQILLSVLSNRFSVDSTALNWFKSYLTDRTQIYTHAGSQTPSFSVDCSVPQGSVFGPLGFASYTEDVADLMNRHNVQFHLYADDTQFSNCCRSTDTVSLRASLSSCASDIELWCRSRRLQLNASKTEAIWFGSKPNLAKLSSTDRSIQVGTSTIQPSAIVRDLGFHLDSELCMKQHVAKTAAACFYHLRRLRQIRRRVGEEVTTRLVIALVISRLDYCNSLLAGLPLCTIEPLQRVQNAAARLIFELSPSEHITPSLLQLHWLPIRWRVQFKLCCFMHAVVTGRCPAYLGSIVQPATQSRSGLRPSSSDFSVPRTRTKFGERAFCYAGPSAWNTLPRQIRETVDSATFRKLLKTHYFTSAFDVV